MSRQEKSAQSHVKAKSLQSAQCQAVLGKFSHLFQACAGPRGKLHMVRNACGGHVTLTGSCSRLLSAMMLSREELKLIVSAVQSHLQRHADGGLFFLTLCTRLILAGVQCEVKSSTLTSLCGEFVDIITFYLTDPACGVIVKTDFSDLSVLLSYVKSVLSSKSLLALSPSDCDQFSQVVVKAFLESIPSDNPEDHPPCNSDNVFFLSLNNVPMSQCDLKPGLLLRYPELPSFQKSEDLSIIYNPLPSGCKVNNSESGQSCILVSLFTCSLSGDFEEVLDSHFELSPEQNASLERQIVRGVLGSLCQTLEQCGVGLLLCQRVVHPWLKAHLRGKGILCVDRIGSQPIPYLHDLTGCQPLSSVLDLDAVSRSLGWITSAQHEILSEQSYLWLQREDCAVSTLVLGAELEERLEELKVCVRAALKGLAELAQCKTLLSGAGCWQAHCAQVLQLKVLSQLSSLAQTHHCTQTTVLQALSVFQGSLECWLRALMGQGVAMLDPVGHHLWRDTQDPGPPTEKVSCCCGGKAMLRKDFWKLRELNSNSQRYSFAPTTLEMTSDLSITEGDSNVEKVFDSFSCGVNALRHSVATAGLLLSICQFITDTN